MANKSGVTDQVLSLPKGGGALKGIGETFQPDLHTGTGNFSVPIALPPGRNGFQPQLTLTYSTGNRNGRRELRSAWCDAKDLKSGSALPGQRIDLPAVQRYVWRRRRQQSDVSVASEGVPSDDAAEKAFPLVRGFGGDGLPTAAGAAVTGNFDGAGLTWGIIGFTLSNGELQKVLEEINASQPTLIHRAFGDLTAELLRLLEASRPEQMGWANQLSLGRTRYRILAEWEDAFERLGSFPEVQAIQLRHVRRYWELSVRDAERFQLKTEAGVALCFDIAVQNGGIDSRVEEPRIERKIDGNPPTTERDVRIIIANVVAENSRAQWVEAVRRRKLTIATGQGEVNLARYDVKTWGIDEVSWAS